MSKVWTSPVTGEQYQLYYCNLCEDINIKCSRCGNTSCNGTSCKFCSDDIDLFISLGFSIYTYMSEDEMRLFERIEYIKRWIKICATAGLDKLDYKYIKDAGYYSEYSYKLFKKEFDDGN